MKIAQDFAFCKQETDLAQYELINDELFQHSDRNVHFGLHNFPSVLLNLKVVAVSLYHTLHILVHVFQVLSLSDMSLDDESVICCLHVQALHRTVWSHESFRLVLHLPPRS